MNLKLSNHPIPVHVRGAGVAIGARLSEAKLVTDMPHGVEVDSFFDLQYGIKDQSLKLYFAWVEGSDLTPADVSECLREVGLLRADATIGAALVRDFWNVLHNILEEGNEFALLGQVSVTDGGVFYATIHQGENYTRVLGTRSVRDQFPSTLPVLVYQRS